MQNSRKENKELTLGLTLFQQWELFKHNKYLYLATDQLRLLTSFKIQSINSTIKK